jgi:hypothetical protein
MLDIGGSNGYYSVILCRRLPELLSVVFDLPKEVGLQATILAQEVNASYIGPGMH